MVLLVAVAFGMRMPAISEPPLEYHQLRQYRSAMIARSYAAQVDPSVVSVPARVAKAAAPGVREVPVVEAIAAIGFVISGSESLWVGRTFSVMSWMAAAVLTFFVGRRLIDNVAGWVGLSFVAFIPSVILPSRSLQPEPLMVAAMMLALLLILRFDDSPSDRRLALSAAGGAAALLVKPLCAFIIVPVFIGMRLWRERSIRALFETRTLLWGGVVVVPAGLWMLYTVAGNGASAGIAEGSVSASYLTSVAYWTRRVDQLAFLATLPVLAIALAGLILASERQRWFFGSALLGYLLYGLVFAWQVSTHSYYNLLATPIIGLLAGIAVSRAWTRLSPDLQQLAALGGIVLIGILAIQGLDHARRYPTEFISQQSQAIGAATDHTTNALLLAPGGGYPLRYHGAIDGSVWPLTADLDFYGEIGIEHLSAEERLNEMIKESEPEFFIVANLEEFDSQPDLQTVLSERYRIHAEGSSWIVFDLGRRPDEQS